MTASLPILATGTNWVAVNKPAGIATERHYDYDTVEKRAEQLWARPRSVKRPFVGIVHRLDRPVSGALLLAKNKSTLVALNKAFEQGATEKIYHAVTDRPLPEREGKLRHYIARDRMGKRAIATTRPIAGAKEAILTYRLLDTQQDIYWWEIRPVTGRFHQIRCQLAVVGAAIIGDAAYGSMRPLVDNCIALHAYSLGFPDPAAAVSEQITVAAPYPDHWPTA